MRHEKTVSVSKIRHLWEPWEEDETPRKYFTHIPGLRVGSLNECTMQSPSTIPRK